MVSDECLDFLTLLLGNTDMVIRVLLDAGFTSELAQNYWSKLDL